MLRSISSGSWSRGILNGFEKWGCYDLGVWRIMEEGRGWSGNKMV